MPTIPLTSASKATTRLVACMSPWSHVRRNLKSRKSTRQHLHLRLSHSRKSPKLRKMWRSFNWRMRRRRRPFKKISLSLPSDGLQCSITSRGVNPPFHTTDLRGSFRPATLIGTQLWNMSTKNIRTIWRTLIGRLGRASPSGMKRMKHISWTQAIRIMFVVPPWKMA